MHAGWLATDSLPWQDTSAHVEDTLPLQGVFDNSWRVQEPYLEGHLEPGVAMPLVYDWTHRPVVVESGGALPPQKVEIDSVFSVVKDVTQADVHYDLILDLPDWIQGPLNLFFEWQLDLDGTQVSDVEFVSFTVDVSQAYHAGARVLAHRIPYVSGHRLERVVAEILGNLLPTHGPLRFVLSRRLFAEAVHNRPIKTKMAVHLSLTWLKASVSRPSLQAHFACASEGGSSEPSPSEASVHVIESISALPVEEVGPNVEDWHSISLCEAE